MNNYCKYFADSSKFIEYKNGADKRIRTDDYFWQSVPDRDLHRSLVDKVIIDTLCLHTAIIAVGWKYIEGTQTIEA